MALERVVTWLNNFIILYSNPKKSLSLPQNRLDSILNLIDIIDIATKLVTFH